MVCDAVYFSCASNIVKMNAEKLCFVVAILTQADIVRSYRRATSCAASYEHLGLTLYGNSCYTLYIEDILAMLRGLEAAVMILTPDQGSSLRDIHE